MPSYRLPHREPDGQLTHHELAHIRDTTGPCPNHRTCHCQQHTAQPTTLRVVTLGQPPAGATTITTPADCDGTMLCQCPQCEHDRSERVQRGVPEVRQPWQARAA